MRCSRWRLLLAALPIAAIGSTGAGRAAEDPLAQAAALQQQAAALQQGRAGAGEPLLERAIAILQKRFGPDDPRVADALGRLADLQESAGRYGQAEPLYRQALAIREKAPGPDRLDLGAALNSLAGLYKLQGRYGKAEPLYRRALAIVENAPAPPVVAVTTILNNLALIDQAEGRYDAAEPLYRRAFAEAGKTPLTARLLAPTVLNNLAGLYKEERRYSEAEPLYAHVLSLREKNGAAPLDLAASLNNLAAVYDAEGRYGEAEPLYKEALDIRKKALGDDHPEVAQSLNNLAGIYWAQGRYDKAEPLLKQALAIKQKTLPPDHPEIAAALNNLAALDWNEGRKEEALAESRRAVAAVAAHVQAQAGRRSGAAIAEYRKSRVYFANYVGIAYGAAKGRANRQAALAADTFRVVQMAEASEAARAVAGMAARFAAGSDALARAVRRRQDLAAQRRRLDAAIVALALRPAAARKPGEEAGLRAALAANRQALAALDKEIGARFPGYAELADPGPAPLAAVQSLLAPDEALLVYLTTPKETWLWAVRPDKAALFRAALGAADLAARVEALRAAMTPRLVPYPATRAFALYREIMAPASSLLAGAHRLIVVPDGALESLPFSLLVTKAPAHDPSTLADYRDLAWLAREEATSLLPAVSSLPALRRTRFSRAAGAPFLGVGDPVLQGNPGGAAAALRRLPALPGSADELRAIAKTLGASPEDLLLGARASEPVLRHMPLDRYRIIEFATHALIGGDLPGLAEPALVLTPPRKPAPGDDGLLTASEIAALKLNADWVVLSACNTAGGGPSGLARAFFYAGARSLLVSNWPVWDKAAVALTTGTFAALRKDPQIGRAEALRRAEMAMLDPKNPPEFAHPFAWAPFVLAGEGGAGR